MTKNIFMWTVIGALLAAVILIVWIFGFSFAALFQINEGLLRLEVFKLLWQFLLLVVIGGAVGFFYKTMEAEANERREENVKNQEKRGARRESLLGIRSDLVKAYHEAKAIRRLLRADAVMGTGDQQSVRREEYTMLMRRLIEAQLDFEDFVDLIESDKLLFPDPEPLKTKLKSVEQYLHDIVDEFEKAYPIFGEKNQEPLSSFKKLSEFVKHIEEGAPFEIKFKTPFHGVLCQIDSLIAFVTGEITGTTDKVIRAQ